VPFIVYFGFLMAALLMGGRFFQHQWLFLLRSFFPNWKFFHALGWVPRLYWRREISSATDRQWSEWALLMPRYERHLSHLVFNPQVNLALSEQNLVEHLSSDIADSASDAKVQDFVTYRMVERLVRLKLEAQIPPEIGFQFCLCMQRLGAPVMVDSDCVLLSSILRPPHAG
jgi:hypothetical protein